MQSVDARDRVYPPAAEAAKRLREAKMAVISSMQSPIVAAPSPQPDELDELTESFKTIMSRVTRKSRSPARIGLEKNDAKMLLDEIFHAPHPPPVSSLKLLNSRHAAETPQSGKPLNKAVAESPEVTSLERECNAREARLWMRARDIKERLKQPRVRQSTAMIRAPEPSIMYANDEEVLRRAEEIERRCEQLLHFDEAEAAEEDGDSPTWGGGTAAAEQRKRAKEKRKNANEMSSESLNAADVFSKRFVSVKPSEATLLILNGIEEQGIVDIVVRAPEDVQQVSHGDVLSSKNVLKRDVPEGCFVKKEQIGIFVGAPCFRMIPKFNIGGVGQPTVDGMRTVLNEVRRGYQYGKIVWVNVRDEPIIYVNGFPNCICSLDNPNRSLHVDGITGMRIAQMEKKLRMDVAREAARNGKNVCVHQEFAQVAGTQTAWEAADTANIVTMEDLAESLNKNDDANIAYFRLPVGFLNGPTVVDLQYVFNLCHIYPFTPIIYSSHLGGVRSSLMMIATAVVEYYQHSKQDERLDTVLLNFNSHVTSCRPIMRVVALLPRGNLHERRVAVFADLSARGYSLNDNLSVALCSRDTSDEMVYLLRTYAILVCFSVFCEARLWLRTFKGTFTEWLDAVPDVRSAVNSIVSSLNLHYPAQGIEIPPGEDVEVAQAVRSRNGNVLSANMILLSLPPLDERCMASGPITGVACMRQLCENVPVFTCGRISRRGRGELLCSIRQHFPGISGIQWISVRDEPMVFINGTGYSLVEYATLTRQGRETPLRENATCIRAERLEELENKMLQDVQSEAARNGGFIIVHEQQKSGNAVARKLKVQDLKCPSSVMNRFVEENDVKYYHIPMPQEWDPAPGDFDPILAHFASRMENDEAVIINDAEGGLRTTLILNFLTAVKLARMTRLRSVKSVEDVKREISVDYEMCAAVSTQGRKTESVFIGMSRLTATGGESDDNYRKHPMPDLQVASVMCQMLAAGSLLSTTRAIIEIGGRGPEWNVLDAVEVAKEDIKNSGGEERLIFQHRALAIARKYLMVLLAVLYIENQKGYDPDLPLGKWVSSLAEIDNVLRTLDSKMQASLRFVLKDNIMAAHSKERAVDIRCGDVLTANFCMKADHFPGCQKVGLLPVICGAPNFRKVENVNVYGAAIPTKVGVRNVLAVLGAYDKPLYAPPGKSNDDNMMVAYPSPVVFDPKFQRFRLPRPLRGSVIWINLREEPIIYVGDRPFVFRNLTEPYVNVELTGIESTTVEHVERKLKVDILNEAQKYNGDFLVHDEGKPGELVGLWEEATDQTVKTVRDVYEDLAGDGARVKFLRLPVTDEQSPELKDFDSLVLALLYEVLDNSRNVTNGLENEPLSFVFNCQMGRGRTTTGMVICCLLIGLVFPGYYEDLNRRYPSHKLYSEDTSNYAHGEYNCIVQLLGLLVNGRRAKHHVDLVLQDCDKMQNLRTAIEGLKKQVESPDVLEEARGRAHMHGVHYLQRYFNLIAFESYLEESFDHKTQRLSLPFADWMEARSEIIKLHDNAQLE